MINLRRNIKKNKKYLMPNYALILVLILISALISTLVSGLVSITTIVAEGSSFRSNPIEIEGRHVIENNIEIKSGRHTFILTASGDAPMPEGSEGGVKRVTINSNEVFTFGSIVYEASGTYEYTVRREIQEADNLIQDNSIYYCQVEVIPDQTAVVVFRKYNTEGKPNRIEYRDRYIPDKQTTRGDPEQPPGPEAPPTVDNPPGPETPPDPSGAELTSDPVKREVTNSVTPVNTGDGSSPYTYLCCLTISLIIIVHIRKKYSKGRFQS